MCRWVAYAGTEIFLEDLLFQQQYSLISQSVRARQSVQTTNGDGFGIAWYGHRRHPGVFKDILPAWNDENLRSLAAQVESRLFFAHVRASTGTSVARSNCHPFTWRQWSFMHNGRIGRWQQCRDAVERSELAQSARGSVPERRQPDRRHSKHGRSRCRRAGSRRTLPR